MGEMVFSVLKGAMLRVLCGAEVAGVGQGANLFYKGLGGGIEEDWFAEPLE